MSKKTVLVRHERPDWTDWYVEQLGAEFKDFTFVAAYSHDEAVANAGPANVIVGIAPQISPRMIAAAADLEWVQSLTTGIDNLLVMDEIPTGVAISKVVGVQGPQMAELALTHMFALARRLPEVLNNQSRGHWDRQPQSLLHNKTVCLLGLGRIAGTLASYCKALGMQVTGISDSRTEAANVDRIYRRSDLVEAAGDADFLVVLIPLSPETRHIVDASVLSAMKPSAYLINIARGGCVDEAALLDALQESTIAGAGVDVFETEPLPSDHPIWTAPNLIVTPHVGGFADVYHEQCFPIVRENFRAYAAGGVEALTDAVRR